MVNSVHFLSIFILFVSSITDADEIILAVENSWPPYADQHGNGISKAIIKQAFKSVDVPVKFVTVPYARALLMAESGDVHGAFNVTRQKDTESRFLFGNEVLLQAQASHFYPKDSNLIHKTIASIPYGTSIGLIIGYEYGNEYEKYRFRFKEVRVSTQKQIIGLLLNKRIDMAIMFDEVARHILQKLKLKQSVIQKGSVNHISDIYVAFSRKKSDIEVLIKQFDEGLAIVKAKKGGIE